MVERERERGGEDAYTRGTFVRRQDENGVAKQATN
jgi:hypothetical protein